MQPRHPRTGSPPLWGRLGLAGRQASLGPWTQLADEARRLQVLSEMGQAGRVLAEVERLLGRMEALPAAPAPGPGEAVTPWNVREVLLGTGRDAARQLGRWEDALGLNAEITASMRERRAPAAGIAGARFSDYFPLLRLGRTREALGLLLECRQIFQDAHDTGNLGKTLSAFAGADDGGSSVTAAAAGLRELGTAPPRRPMWRRCAGRPGDPRRGPVPPARRRRPRPRPRRAGPQPDHHPGPGPGRRSRTGLASPPEGGHRWGESRPGPFGGRVVMMGRRGRDARLAWSRGGAGRGGAHCPIVAVRARLPAWGCDS